MQRCSVLPLWPLSSLPCLRPARLSAGLCCDDLCCVELVGRFYPLVASLCHLTLVACKPLRALCAALAGKGQRHGASCRGGSEGCRLVELPSLQSLISDAPASTLAGLPFSDVCGSGVHSGMDLIERGHSAQLPTRRAPFSSQRETAPVTHTRPTCHHSAPFSDRRSALTAQLVDPTNCSNGNSGSAPIPMLLSTPGANSTGTAWEGREILSRQH